ncbi:MAG: M23 family metallopeptidase [Nitrospirae bacterium]|nr:M23 family metallopeptidase [Nitrospirota bacterium]
MKKLFFCLILSVLLTSSCSTRGPFSVGNPHGGFAAFGERRHPGIDFRISSGTPLIAPSDGVVIYIGEPFANELWGGGFFVGISHGEQFYTLYGHLSKVFVEKGQSLKRGELIGLSGSSNLRYAHLHFGVCKITEDLMDCQNYSKTYDPDDFWLEGKARCFDPKTDYSGYSQKDITLPIECGETAKELMARTKSKDQN